MLSQFPDDQVSVSVTGTPPPHYDSFSSDNRSNNNSGGKTKVDRGGLDWDHTVGQPNRANNIFSSPLGLQRQSSGSSFAESSFTGDYYMPTLSESANEIEPIGFPQDEEIRIGFSGVDGDMRIQITAAESGGGSSSAKSWAQQTEESYQLQLALALRLSSEATCADDPNFLDPRICVKDFSKLC